MSECKYMTGFGNYFATEALPGALPKGQNSPQRPPFQLYPEQLNGTAFTAPRGKNLRSWLYRMQPTVGHPPFQQVEHAEFQGEPWKQLVPSPNQLRWNPLDPPVEDTDFLDGLVCMVGAGEVGQSGSALYHFAINAPMDLRFIYFSDGEVLFLPFEGELSILTEMGVLEVKPREMALIPRGVKFQVNPLGKLARGYFCENFGQVLGLPELGPIGANGLANPRDFQYPRAQYTRQEGTFLLFNKYGGHLFVTELDHNPCDVVAWHGNLAPYKYDLGGFNTINTVSFDHPDPSIFTVLTSPSGFPGVANLDFVIFPPRWMVAEKTFRPPYYHRNYMNEYMGLIEGVYDAKAQGFIPGGASLHNRMSGHGPDAKTFEMATRTDLKPEYQGNTLAFMFESHQIYRATQRAMESPQLDDQYWTCWKNLKNYFPGDELRR